jgi:pyruvate ferredoxin oxidoreductase alpha subunit
VVEHLSELVADGELDAEFVPVESEHSAMSVCCGTAAVGARTFTATASQGLALMHEILYIASALRLPIVMTVANRALSSPINIWNDHSDIMAERDVGWVQIFAESAQEAADLTIWAFRLGEDKRVSLPVMMNFDGFILTHTIEPVLMPDRETVQAFLPPWEPLLKLDVDDPVTMGPVGIPDIYTEAKQVHQHVLTESYGPIVETLEEFSKHFGRSYKPVETYRADDAEVLLCTMGALGQTAMEVVDQRRKKGQKAGLVRLRLWRPFPFEDLYKAVGKVPVLGVMDRCVSLGGPIGPVASEIKSAFYNREHQPKIVEFVAGLGGRDVPLSDFDRMFDDIFKTLETGKVPDPVMVGLRE